MERSENLVLASMPSMVLVFMGSMVCLYGLVTFFEKAFANTPHGAPFALPILFSVFGFFVLMFGLANIKNVNNQQSRVLKK